MDNLYETDLEDDLIQVDARTGPSTGRSRVWLDRMSGATTDKASSLRMERTWFNLVSFVASDSPMEGRFDPNSPLWHHLWGMPPDISRELAVTFADAGGLDRRGGRFFVPNWVPRPFRSDH